MAQNTISFDNKKGYWKTRYSFIASCYSFLDKLFFSSPKTSVSGQVLWGHNAGVNNKFYGQQKSSGLAVTFNDHVSNNKVFKTLSLEGTSNIEGLNTFKVNNSSDPTQLKTTHIGTLQERGGIMYGDIGKVSKITGSNIKTIGVLNSFIPEAEFPSGLLVDSEGAPAVYSGAGSLWAFKMDAYFSNHPIPSSSEVKLFISLSDAYGSTAKPLYKTTADYTFDTAAEGVNYASNDNFLSDSILYSDYLTYGKLYSGDPYNSWKKGDIANKDTLDALSRIASSKLMCVLFPGRNSTSI